MPRKSKQAGSGHLPLTHYETNTKFKSSRYGTTTERLLGDTIAMPFGYCNLSLTPIESNSSSDGNSSEGNSSPHPTTNRGGMAIVTPSGYTYEKESIYAYLIQKRQEISVCKKKFEQEQRQEEEEKKEESKPKKKDNVLKRTSYWLPDMQPAEKKMKLTASDIQDLCPMSPNSGNPLRRKELKEVRLLYEQQEEGGRSGKKRKQSTNNDPPRHIVCAISGKVIRYQQAVAYFIKSSISPVGTIALKDVYDMTIEKKKKKDAAYCPLTGEKIRHVILLQRGASGTNYCANHMGEGSNKIQAKKYNHTIT